MATDDGGTRNVNRSVAFVFGALWAVGGIAALLAARRVPFTSPEGVKLLGEFGVNGLRGVLMIVAAVALLGAAIARPGAARRANLVVGGLWVVLDVFSLLTGHSTLNVLALHGHDADLLLLAALALLASGLVLDLPPTHGSGPKYRTVRYGQGPRYVEAGDLPDRRPS